SSGSPSATRVGLYVGVPLALAGLVYYASTAGSGDEKLAALKKKALTNPTAALNGTDFIDFELKRVETLTPNTNRFVFALPDGATHLGLPTTSCVLAKSGDTVRPYTPLEDPVKGTTGEFELVVKKYKAGPMSEHIFSLQKGDTLALKGPIPKYPYVKNKDGHIALVAGGTGIAPMLQVVQRVLADPSDKTTLSLLFANISEQDIILRDYLDGLAKKHADRFSVFYTLDKPPAGWKGFTGFVDAEKLSHVLPKPGQGKVFVCGPPGMVASLSGPKAKDFSQGELTGLLAKLGYSKDDVFKF
ncbi:NADH-cytochrome b5 reductase, partial [Physocladia obscura]